MSILSKSQILTKGQSLGFRLRPSNIRLSIFSEMLYNAVKKKILIFFFSLKKKEKRKKKKNIQYYIYYIKSLQRGKVTPQKKRLSLCQIFELPLSQDLFIFINLGVIYGKENYRN